MAFYTTIESPVGPLFLGGSAAGIHRLVFLEPEESRLRTVYTLDGSVTALERDAGESAARDPQAASEAARQLREYFEGARTAFDLPLAARGTAFQVAVWDVLTRIPAGETRSYGEVAAMVGAPSASRAVGMANGRNPIAIVVPCHRVVGADGTLTGYGGGLHRKRWLLDHESSSMPLFATARG
jgi:methylated-DNA-[protein]-cysteine S-methyltransferase